jgi:hypothetical protein
MEKTVNVWKANLVNGLILGLIGVVYTLVIYFLDQTFNKSLNYIFLVIEIIILFFLVKAYRDNAMFGAITYGQALGAGVVIFLYATIITSIFSALLFSVIDPELMSKGIAASEEALQKRGMPQEQIDLAMKYTAKMMKPAIMIPIGLITSMFYGLIMSLIVAAFVRKEGNPLVDTTQQ